MATIIGREAESAELNRALSSKEADLGLYMVADVSEKLTLSAKHSEPKSLSSSQAWLNQALNPSWKSWSGIAFEGICLKHIADIKNALGITAVYTEESPWRFRPKESQLAGIQIDLLIDRQDRCINLCEMKFSIGKFRIDKKYAENLHQTVSLFRQYSGTRKSVFLTAVTTFGVQDNIHKTGLVQNEVMMEAFF